MKYITNNLQILDVRKVNTELYFTSFNWKKKDFWSCIFLAYMQWINWHLSQHLLNIHRRRFLFQVPSNLKLIFIKPDTCFWKMWKTNWYLCSIRYVVVGLVIVYLDEFSRISHCIFIHKVWWYDDDTSCFSWI